MSGIWCLLRDIGQHISSNGHLGEEARHLVVDILLRYFFWKLADSSKNTVIADGFTCSRLVHLPQSREQVKGNGNLALDLWSHSVYFSIRRLISLSVATWKSS